MPDSRPRGLAPFPKHKQRRSAEVHARQLPFTPTRAGENKGINHRRLVGFLPHSSAALSLKAPLLLMFPSKQPQPPFFPSFLPTPILDCLRTNSSTRMHTHTHTLNVLKVLLYSNNIWPTKRHPRPPIDYTSAARSTPK